MQDNGESGIGGTVITLTGVDEFGNVVNETTTTCNCGHYSFADLNPSNSAGYTVTETVPAGYTHEGQTSTTPGVSRPRRPPWSPTSF